ncbi:hypothetical protein AO379_0699 [Moraxella catarrhalis]|nr:hypothetical protein AO379_0699 [Moraxella catarrhalis]
MVKKFNQNEQIFDHFAIRFERPSTNQLTIFQVLTIFAD